MQFSVSLAKASPLKATVAFATKDGSAAAGTDYVAMSGNLVFAPGETTKSVAVSIMGDTVVEADETFSVELSKPVNASLGRAAAAATIKNEDVPKPKAGRYNGTSSQTRSISFDVDAAATRVSNVTMIFDLDCKEVRLTFANERIDLPVSISLGPDWRFSFTDSFADSDGSFAVRFDGGLSVAGPASGTLRVDLKVNVPGGVVNCTTGEISWSASPPA